MPNALKGDPPVKLFISYRRTDSEPITKRIHALLEAEFGNGNVFIDKDLEPGDWWTQVVTAINRADACLIVIGAGWLTAINAETGKPRLFDLEDVVRREIELSLMRPLKVILLLNDAHVPSIAQIPATIRHMPDMQAFEVRDGEHLEADVKSVARKIKVSFGLPTETTDTAETIIVPPPDPLPPRRLPVMAGGIAALAVIALLIALASGVFNNGGVPTPTLAPPATTAIVAVATDAPTTAPESPADTATIEVPLTTPAPTLTPSPTIALELLAQTFEAEQTLTTTARFGAETATESAAQTATATQWTPTPIPPTPNQTRTFEAFLTERAAGTSTAARTQTMAAWTDTPTPTFTPTLTPTLTPLEAALLRAEVPMTSNEARTPFVNTFADGVSMMLVPAGCFTMGSADGKSDERPVSEQCFTEPFWIDQTEVTQADFGRLEGVKANSNAFTGDQRPVEQITWFEARDFCALRGGRLPTEAEWEYAARGPEGWVYPWGDEFVADNVIYSSNSGSQTALVGATIRTAGASWVGALDLSGNVWEWMSTIRSDYPYDAADGREDMNKTDVSRVLRGGSFFDASINLRAALRGSGSPVFVDNAVGFRCVRSQ